MVPVCPRFQKRRITDRFVVGTDQLTEQWFLSEIRAVTHVSLNVNLLQALCDGKYSFVQFTNTYCCTQVVLVVQITVLLLYEAVLYTIQVVLVVKIAIVLYASKWLLSRK